MSQQLAPLKPQIVAHKPALHALKPIQRRAILALLDSPSIRKAAEVVGRNERTLYRWLRNPLFRRCLHAACASHEITFELQAQHSYGVALSVLTDIAAQDDAQGPLRVQAARHLLEYTDRRAERRLGR